MKNRFGRLWDVDAGVTTKKKGRKRFVLFIDVIYIRVFLLDFQGKE